MLVGNEGTPAEAMGKGGGEFEVKLPRGIKVLKYEPIVIPTLGIGIFGIVEEIITNPADPFQTILFTNPINIQSIQMVTIDL